MTKPLGFGIEQTLISEQKFVILQLQIRTDAHMPVAKAQRCLCSNNSQKKN